MEDKNLCDEENLDEESLIEGLKSFSSMILSVGTLTTSVQIDRIIDPVLKQNSRKGISEAILKYV